VAAAWLAHTIEHVVCSVGEKPAAWGQAVQRIVTCTGWTRHEGRYQRQKIIVGLAVGLAVHKTGRRGVQLCSPWRASRRGRRVRWPMLQGGEGVEAPGGEDAAPRHHSAAPDLQLGQVSVAASRCRLRGARRLTSLPAR
jgi:hypothetical protein